MRIWVEQPGNDERRESPRASGEWLENGRSGEMKESTWTGRSERVVEKGTEEQIVTIMGSLNPDKVCKMTDVMQP